MSQAIGPFCDLKQDVTSWNNTEGAAVAIDMTEYERESKILSLFDCNTKLMPYKSASLLQSSSQKTDKN